MGGGLRVLGSVTIDHGAGELPPASTSVTTLLALLAVRPGRPVDPDVLVANLWSAAAFPEHPRPALQVLVTRLRRWCPWAVRLDRGGYRLDVVPDEVDLHRFHRADDGALVDVEAALDQWRGEPFAGCLLGEILSAERDRAVRRLLHLQERRIELLLAADRAADAADAAWSLATAHPERESLVALAMTALYAAGRQPEALAVFARARDVLRDEWGLDPTAELVSLQRRILVQDAVLTAPTSGPTPAPVIVGRDRLLAGLAVRTGDAGRVVLVEGEAGIGKSTVLRVATARARRDGVRVGAGAWDEGGAPLTGWREALAPLGLVATSAHGPLVHTGLADAAAERPLLLALDDVQWADSASLGVLRTLLRLGVPRSVLVLLATRPAPAATAADAGRPWEDARTELTRSAGVTVVTVGELDLTDVRRYVAHELHHLGPAPAARVADVVARRSGGHPLHLAALLDLLRAAGDDEGACRSVVDRVPESLRALLAGPLTRLPELTRRAVEAAAVLGPIDLEALAVVLAIDPLTLAQDLRPGVEQRLLHAGDGDEIAFRHELVAAAVGEAVPAWLRARLHRARLCRLADDADAFVRLRHAEGAERLLDAAEVAQCRLAAARRAHQDGALIEAVELVTAATAGLPASAHGEASVVRGLALAGLGRRDEADDELDAALGRPGLAPEMAVRAAVGEERLGRAAAGDARRLARLHEVLGRDLHEDLRGEVVRAVVAEESLVHGRVITPGAAEEFAQRCARLRADAPVLARARVLAARAAQLVEAPVPAVERLAAARAAEEEARRTDDPMLRMHTTELRIAAALAAGRPEEACERRVVLGKEADRWFRPRSMWSAQLVEAALSLAEGEYETADAAARTALRRGQDLGVPDAAGAYGLHLVTRHWIEGRLGELGDLAVRVAAQYPHIAGWSAVAALTAVQVGDAASAHDHLDRWRTTRAGSPSRTFDRAGLCLAAAAAFSLRDRGVAQVVREALPVDRHAVPVVGVGAALFGPVTLFTGMSEDVLGGDPAEAFDHAVALAGRLGWKPWEAAARVLAERARGEGPGEPALPLGLDPDLR